MTTHHFFTHTFCRFIRAIAIVSTVLALFSCEQSQAEFAAIFRGSQAELVALNVNDKLSKNTYALGEALDISYLFVQGEYSDGTKRKIDISVEQNISGYDAMKTGKQELTIFVGEISAKWKVEVINKAPLRLEILSLPDKTVYAQGEAFEVAGLTARLTYTDGTFDESALDENFVIGFSSSDVGEIECNAVWKGQRAPFTLTIVDCALVSVRMDAPPDVVRYVLSADGNSAQVMKDLSADTAEIPVSDGAFFPLTDGIAFTGTYTDGSEKALFVSDAVEKTQVSAQSGTVGVSFLFGEYRGEEIRAGFTAYVYEHDFHIAATRAQGNFSGADELIGNDGKVIVIGKASYSTGHNGKGAFGKDGEQTEIAPFVISAAEESYTQWVNVRAWAVENGYIFSDRAGIEGSEGDMLSTDKSPESDKGTGQPVCYVNLRDVVVYCNAKSRMAELDPVYFGADGTELKDAEDGECGNPIMHKENSGYRLATAEEWEFAARGGVAALFAQDAPKEAVFPDDFNRSAWKAPWAGAESSKEIANYCVYEGSNSVSTEKCASRRCNALGIYDMSGNAAEWTETFAESDTTSDESRIVMGGSYFDIAVMIQVSCRLSTLSPDKRAQSIGFRTVRNAPAR